MFLADDDRDIEATATVRFVEMKELTFPVTYDRGVSADRIEQEIVKKFRLLYGNMNEFGPAQIITSVTFKNS